MDNVNEESTESMNLAMERKGEVLSNSIHVQM